MNLTVLKAKIHNGIITEANPDYDGSLTVDSELLAACGMRAYEKVLVVNLTNGNRLETYLIEGRPGSREICANGGAALLFEVGDAVIVMCFCHMSPEELKGFKPSVIKLNTQNEIIKTGTI